MLAILEFSVIVHYNTRSLEPGTLPERAGKEQMNSRFELHTKGIISLAIILMFTIALIAGQARANLPAEASVNTDFARATEVSIALDTESLQKIDALAHLIDTMLALPIDSSRGKARLRYSRCSMTNTCTRKE